MKQHVPVWVTLGVLLAGRGAAQQVATIEVVRPGARLIAGDSVPVRAVAKDSAGRDVSSATFRWFTNNPNAAYVTDSGMLVTLDAGRVTVIALSGREVGRLEVEIGPAPVATLGVSLPARTLYVGASAPAKVDARTRRGRPRRDAVAVFGSSAPAVASVDAAGRVVALRAGTARIEATVGKARGSTVVQVVASPVTAVTVTPTDTTVRTGDVVRFLVAARAGSRGLPQPYVEWSATGEGATVFEDGGFVAERPGVYVVTALVGGRAGRASVIVGPRQVTKRDFKLVGRGSIRDVHTADLLIFDQGGKTWAYVPSWGADALYIYDVTNAASPVLTDSVKVDARVINDVTITPDHRYAVMTREGASSRKNGIVILDTSDPGHPKAFSEYTETVTGGVHNAWTEGYYVFATDDATGSLRVIDIHDPKAPKEVARWQVDRPGGRALHDVIVQDGLAYLSYGYDGLVVLDVGAGIRGGSPTSPTFVTQYKDFQGEFWTHTAWRYKNYVIVGDELFPPSFGPDQPEFPYGYFHIVDVSDWDHPREVARYEIPNGGSHNVWMEGDILYVGYYQGGLRAIDLSGELRGDLVAQGRELAAYYPIDVKGKIPNWPFVWGPQVHNGLVYASDFNAGLWIVKLEPQPPVP
ncbi:MAG TPA: Ig-like domain-containing protein [Gemmatimonadales bacterium]|nr:Ig-like domain-containing protein [Gemmatimonadales bacterium]